MPLRQHLAELRSRLMWSAIGIAACSIAGWFLFDPAFEALQTPVMDLAERDGRAVTINFAGLATALDVRLKVSVFLGVIIASPWWLYHTWAFIAPGLRRRERSYTLGFLGAAVPLFLGGVVLAWWVFPRAVNILVGFTPDGGANILDVHMYLAFAMRVVLAFGLAFVFPVAMVMLTWMGAVKTSAWLRGWRWAVLVLLVFGAIITPTPDVITMLALSVPMVALYFSAIGIGALHPRVRRKQET